MTIYNTFMMIIPNTENVFDDYVPVTVPGTGERGEPRRKPLAIMELTCCHAGKQRGLGNK